MLVSPRIGQEVDLRYGLLRRPVAPLHGCTGIVRIVSRGPGPRNHGVEVNGTLYVVPCGQLFSRRNRQELTTGSAVATMRA